MKINVERQFGILVNRFLECRCLGLVLEDVFYGE